MTIRRNNSALHSDVHIICVNSNEKLLLLLTPHADGNLDWHLEPASGSQKAKVSEGEASLSVQIIRTEPKPKNALPIMNYHY